ncbi:MAG: hypothetical protein ACLVAW_05700 [Eisenbergiella massiliensis]
MLAGCGSSAKQETPAAAADTGAAVSEQPAESGAAQTGASGRQTDGKNVPELTGAADDYLMDISTGGSRKDNDGRGGAEIYGGLPQYHHKSGASANDRYISSSWWLQ